MTHEYQGADDHAKIGTERNFGFVMAGFFALLSGFAWWNDGDRLIIWLVISAAFLIVALAAPSLLAPLNRLWFRFGMLLNAIVSPVIMGLLFFVTITPIGWLMRLLGARPLKLKFDRAAQSYWIHRDPPGPPPDSLKNQF